MGTKLLWLLLLLLLLLLLISLASAGLRLTNGPHWRPRVVHPQLQGKGDYQILSRRSPQERHPWKPPYNRRG